MACPRQTSEASQVKEVLQHIGQGCLEALTFFRRQYSHAMGIFPRSDTPAVFEAIVVEGQNMLPSWWTVTSRRRRGGWGLYCTLLGFREGRRRRRRGDEGVVR